MRRGNLLCIHNCKLKLTTTAFESNHDRQVETKEITKQVQITKSLSFSAWLNEG